ncbi:10621_t:CDS:2, partial [Funneliformis mosseae]
QRNEDTKLYDLKCTIYELLFKLFISNDISLNSLYVKICHSQHVLNVMIFNEICKKPKFLSDIKYFTLDFDRCKVIPNLPIPSFEYSPSAITSNKHFTIYFNSKKNLSERNLKYLIKSQTQLLSLTLYTISSKVAYLMSALKYCSNTLTSIKLNSCDFNGMPSLNGLNYLIHLESLQFKHCKVITVQVFRPLLEISTPLKIKTLTLEGLIQFLHISGIVHVDIVQLFKLITHVRKHLQYLSLQIRNHRQPCFIESDYEQQLRVSSMILTNLGQILPDTLKYLELKLVIDPIKLKIFLDNCKHIVGLNSLLVMNNSQNDNIFDVLKEFVREKK